MLIGRSVFPSPCGRSPRADEVMAFGRRTVTMSFSGLRPIFAIGGSAGAVCGSYKPRGFCGAPEDGFAASRADSVVPRRMVLRIRFAAPAARALRRGSRGRRSAAGRDGVQRNATGCAARLFLFLFPFSFLTLLRVAAL